MFLFLFLLIGLMNYNEILKNISIEIKQKKIENFKNSVDNRDESIKETPSEALVKAMKKTINVANTLGRRLLDPTMWSERMNLINKSPMDLARMHIMSNS